MKLALAILLLLYCVQGLVKFAVHFVLPYEKRIRQIARYYSKDHRSISVYDTITLLLQIAIVVLLFATDLHSLSFLAGLFVGMSVVQVYFHRFIRPLPADKTPESPTPPVKLVSYAIQAQPGLAWREYILMAAASIWGIYILLADVLFSG